MKFKQRVYEVSEPWSKNPPKTFTTRAGLYDGHYWTEADITFYEKLQSLLTQYKADVENDRKLEDATIRQSVASLIEQTEAEPVRKRTRKVTS